MAPVSIHILEQTIPLCSSHFKDAIRGHGRICVGMVSRIKPNHWFKSRHGFKNHPKKSDIVVVP